MWEYIGFDPPLNCRRTLDQYGYPSLQDTNARDDDQMLYKLTKQNPKPSWSRARSMGIPVPRPGTVEKVEDDKYDKTSGEENDDSSDDDTTYEEESDLRDGNLLMVDQLWLWAIDTSELLHVHSGWKAHWSWKQERALTKIPSHAYHILSQERVGPPRGNAVSTG